MFGMGFFEIFLIAIIAIVALGPEKLPNAMIDVARFLKKFKSGVEDAKSTLDNELNISEMKEEASKFKAQIEDAKSTVSMEPIDLGIDKILNDDLVTDETTSTEKVSFKSQNKKNKEKIEKSEAVEPKEATVNKADKFKVNQDNEENS